MQKILTHLCCVLLLSACATGTPIKEFSDKSVGYGWLDIKDVEANRLHAVTIYQFRPQTATPYYRAGIIPLKDGFLYYHIGLSNGSYKITSAAGQTCIGFVCGNTMYQYSFGKQGDAVGAVVISSPGIYSLGSFKMKRVKTGLFEEGKFDVEPAPNAPTKREQLETLLKEVDEPVVIQRIKNELARS